MNTLPTHWQVVPLHSLVLEAQSGFASGKRDDNGTIQVRMNNVTTEGNWDWSKVLRVPASDNQIQKYSLKIGDVLVNTTNSPSLVGKTVYFSGSNDTLVFSNHFMRLRLKNHLLYPNYLRRWLNVLWSRKVFKGLCTQWVNQASIRKEDLLAVKIPLPPLEEQRRIAAILDKADAVRRKREEAIRLTEELLRSLFLDMFGDPVTNPMGWEVKKLEKVCSRVTVGYVGSMASEYIDEGIPWLRSLNIKRNQVVLNELKYVSNDFHKKLSKSSLSPRDVVTVRTGNAGVTTVIPKSLPESNCSDLIVMTCSSLLVPSYLSETLNLLLGDRNGGMGLTGAIQKHFNITRAKQLTIPLPPLHEQEKWEHLANKIVNLKYIHENNEENSHNLFNSLLQKAFRGEL